LEQLVIMEDSLHNIPGLITSYWDSGGDDGIFKLM